MVQALTNPDGAVKKDFVIYVCPICGETIEHEYPSDGMPYLNCFHGAVYVMQPVFDSNARSGK